MRQTGKTFRALLEAIVKASEGHCVVFTTHNFHHANELTREAQKIIQNYGIREISVRERLINFNNGGGIRFITPEDHARVVPSNKVWRISDIEDHQMWSKF